MPLTNLQYEQIKKQYDARQRRHRLELEERVSYVNEHVPGFQMLNDSLSSLCMQQAKRILEGDDHALCDLKQSIQTLKQQKENLLLEYHIPDDYLTPTYDCPDCQDTGYRNGERCHCYKQAVMTLLYDQSNIRDYLESLDFSTISDRFYKGEDRVHFHNAYEKTTTFIQKFSSEYQNLIFYGTVGTGKSFLSAYIAKSLIDRGYFVIYFSSSSLIDMLSRYTFDYKGKEDASDPYRDIYESDLLIIDDLGTELSTAFSVSRLFSCLNERFLRKKSTVISTNLSLEELRDRYSDRIFSRLTGNYIFCRLSGPDIRLMQ